MRGIESNVKGFSGCYHSFANATKNCLSALYLEGREFFWGVPHRLKCLMKSKLAQFFCLMSSLDPLQCLLSPPPPPAIRLVQARSFPPGPEQPKCSGQGRRHMRDNRFRPVYEADGKQAGTSRRGGQRCY